MEIKCPACGEEIKAITEIYETPHFGEILISSILCECGFKHSDSFVMGIKDPIRFTLKINRENYHVKVIKSSSGTIRIPEIGVDIEPGPASEAYITNLEGVLIRIKDMVKVAMKWNEGDPEKVEKCEKILSTIEDTLEGDTELTLIVEDPLGNSLIESKDAKKELIDKEEASKLKSNISIFSSQDQ